MSCVKPDLSVRAASSKPKFSRHGDSPNPAWRSLSVGFVALLALSVAALADREPNLDLGSLTPNAYSSVRMDRDPTTEGLAEYWACLLQGGGEECEEHLGDNAAALTFLASIHGNEDSLVLTSTTH